MVVIVLILLSLGVVLFIMLSDTRRNNNFKRLEQAALPDTAIAADGADPASGEPGGDGGNAGRE